MRKTRFTQMVVLVCIGSLAGCTSGEGGTVGNTELNVVVPGGSALSGPGTNPVDIQSVEYTINCDGTASVFLDNDTPLPNDGAVQINGNLEVVDGRTDVQGPIPPEFGTARPGDGAEIWQGFMDLPVGPCTIQLRARDNDGEVICTATEAFDIVADTTSKVNLVLVCDTSFQAPVGSLDVDATFSFVVGNFCPDLFVINCNPQDENVSVIDTPVGPQAPAGCQVRARDVDSTCGQSCDPQSCVETPEGLTCTPGPDPGVTTTVVCTAAPAGSAVVDCNVDGIPDGDTCVFTGDTLGSVGQQPPNFLAPGEGGWVVGFAVCTQAIVDGVDPGCGIAYPCPIPGLCANAGQVGEPLFPGATMTCVATTTDGDVDCDKSKTVVLNGPGLSPCAAQGCLPGQPCAFCDDGNQCTSAVCDDTSGVALCPQGPLDDTTSCDPGTGGPGLCDGSGSCVADGCTGDADCELDGLVCTVPPVGSCDVGTGTCQPEIPGNDGGACDSTSGGNGTDGTCSGGSCVDNCSGVDCSDGNECTDDVCDSNAGGACSNPNSPVGTPCTSVPNGACDGAGTCAAPPVIDAGGGSSTWEANTDLGGGNGTADGCTVFVTTISNDIFLDVAITVAVNSDGSNNISTGWTVTAQNSLLPVLQNAAEYGGIAIDAAVTNATPASIPSSTGPNGGQLLSAYIAGTTLTFATPLEITAGAAAATPTAGAGSTVNVNWSGQFTLDLTLGGAPLVTVDESVCIFDVIGAGVDLGVN